MQVVKELKMKGVEGNVNIQVALCVSACLHVFVCNCFSAETHVPVDTDTEQPNGIIEMGTILFSISIIGQRTNLT